MQTALEIEYLVDLCLVIITQLCALDSVPRFGAQGVSLSSARRVRIQKVAIACLVLLVTLVTPFHNCTDACGDT